MITNFKIFENKLITLEANSYIVVYGDQSQIIEILEKTKNSDIEDQDLKGIIKDLKKNKNLNISGIFIIKNYEKTLYYSKFFNDVIRKIQLKRLLYDKTFAGELKLKDNKVILDTLEVDINKYNL